MHMQEYALPRVVTLGRDAPLVMAAVSVREIQSYGVTVQLKKGGYCFHAVRFCPSLQHATLVSAPIMASFAPCYVPTPAARARLSPTAQQRVALSPATHKRLKRIAHRRFGSNAAISRLGSIVLTHYLSHMERFYFGRVGASACAPVPESMRDYDAVIFDMDGVLCDSEVASRRAGAEVFRKFYNTEVNPDDFEPFTGTGEVNFLAGVAGVYDVPNFDGETAKQHFFDVYIKGGYSVELEPFPGVSGLIERIKQMGLKVAVASAADAVKVDANLTAIGLPRSTFSFVTSSDDIVNKKPAPDVFLAAAAGLGVKPERCVVVEDAVAGVQGALAAGMRCVAVATSLSREALEEGGADVVRDEPAFIEISDLFGKDVFGGIDAKEASGSV